VQDASNLTALGSFTLDSVRRKSILWRVPGLIPAGMLSVLGGEQGTGKGLLVAAWTAELTRRGLGVMIAPAEDSPEYSLRPRMQAAGADMSRVHILPEFVLPDDAGALGNEILSKEPAWLVLDPVTEYISALYNENSGHAVRQALGPLTVIAQATGTAVTWIMHLTKGESTSALKRFSGSGGYTQLARSAFLLSKNPNDENPNARYLAHVKSNISERMSTEQWEVEPIFLPATADEPDTNTARIRRVGASLLTSEELLGPTQTSEEVTEYDRACELIHEQLHGGRAVESRDLDSAGEAEGISRRTMERARRSAGVRAFQRDRKWWVELRESPDFVTAEKSQTVTQWRSGGLGSEPASGAVSQTAKGRGGLSDGGLTCDSLGTDSLDTLRQKFKDDA
jgi:hypothetical protein